MDTRSAATGDTRRRRTIGAAAALLLALVLAASPVMAQRAPRSVLVVRVKDEQGHPLPRAYVTVGGVDHGASTNDNGEAKVPDIPEGNRLVEVRRQGYAFARTAADFAGGDTVHRELRMTPQPVELEGITATSWGRSTRLVHTGFYNRQRQGLGAYLTRQRLDEIRPYRTVDALRYMRGFIVVPVGRGTKDAAMSTRGLGTFGGCVPMVYIDRMRMFIRSGEDEADALSMIPPDDVEAIEAYGGPSEIPTEYNPTGSACGVILIWTKFGG